MQISKIQVAAPRKQNPQQKQNFGAMQITYIGKITENINIPLENVLENKIAGLRKFLEKKFPHIPLMQGNFRTQLFDNPIPTNSPIDREAIAAHRYNKPPELAMIAKVKAAIAKSPYKDTVAVEQVKYPYVSFDPRHAPNPDKEVINPDGKISLHYGDENPYTDTLNPDRTITSLIYGKDNKLPIISYEHRLDGSCKETVFHQNSTTPSFIKEIDPDNALISHKEFNTAN